KKCKFRKCLSVMLSFMLIFFLSSFAADAAEPNFDNPLVTTSKKPSQGGALRIIDWDGQKTLGDESGKPIQLRGMSTHGLQWFPEIINKNAFECLSRDWDCNVIRLAMYIGENGYAQDPSVKERVIKGIEL